MTRQGLHQFQPARLLSSGKGNVPSTNAALCPQGGQCLKGPKGFTCLLQRPTWLGSPDLEPDIRAVKTVLVSPGC